MGLSAELSKFVRREKAERRRVQQEAIDEELAQQEEAREEEAQDARTRELEQQQKRRGRASTILTGPQGLLGPEVRPETQGASRLLGR